MSDDEALEADRAGDMERAAKLYEETISAGDASLQTYLNLALLYWRATDPGLAAAKHFTDFFHLAGRRFTALLKDAELRFPSSTAVRFWLLYIPWADLGEPLDPERCRRLLREDPKELIPAMYLFNDSEGKEAREEAATLLHQARAAGTTGAGYVVSFLESAFKSFEGALP